MYFPQLIEICCISPKDSQFRRGYYFVATIFIYAIFYMYALHVTDSPARVRNISDQMHLQVTQRSSIFQRHGNVHTLHMSPRWHISNNASFYDNLRFISHDVLHYSCNSHFVYRNRNLNYKCVNYYETIANVMK